MTSILSHCLQFKFPLWLALGWLVGIQDAPRVWAHDIKVKHILAGAPWTDHTGSPRLWQRGLKQERVNGCLCRTKSQHWQKLSRTRRTDPSLWTSYPAPCPSPPASLFTPRHCLAQNSVRGKLQVRCDQHLSPLSHLLQLRAVSAFVPSELNYPQVRAFKGSMFGTVQKSSWCVFSCMGQWIVPRAVSVGLG